jgi:hypothetical protein
MTHLEPEIREDDEVVKVDYQHCKNYECECVEKHEDAIDKLGSFGGNPKKIACICCCILIFFFIISAAAGGGGGDFSSDMTISYYDSYYGDYISSTIEDDKIYTKIDIKDTYVPSKSSYYSYTCPPSPKGSYQSSYPSSSSSSPSSLLSSDGSESSASLSRGSSSMRFSS